jgi:AraC-like DNA-binding protein
VGRLDPRGVPEVSPAGQRTCDQQGYGAPSRAVFLWRCGWSGRSSTWRQFRDRYGVAPSAYLRQLRLREARRLAAGAAIAEVAFATGFADQSHLTRWFRRTYGITRTSSNKAGASRPDPTHREGRRLAGRPQRVAFQAARGEPYDEDAARSAATPPPGRAETKLAVPGSLLVVGAQ